MGDFAFDPQAKVVAPPKDKDQSRVPIGDPLRPLPTLLDVWKRNG